MSVLGKIVSRIDSAKEDGNIILKGDAPAINLSSVDIGNYTLPDNSVWKIETSKYYDETYTFNVLYIDGTPEISMKVNGWNLALNSGTTTHTHVSTEDDTYEDRKDNNGFLSYHCPAGPSKEVLSCILQKKFLRLKIFERKEG